MDWCCIGTDEIKADGKEVRRAWDVEVFVCMTRVGRWRWYEAVMTATMVMTVWRQQRERKDKGKMDDGETICHGGRSCCWVTQSSQPASLIKDGPPGEVS